MNKKILLLFVLLLFACETKQPLQRPLGVIVNPRNNVVIWNKVINDSLDHYNLYVTDCTNNWGEPIYINKADTSYQLHGLQNQVWYYTAMTSVGIDGRETIRSPYCLCQFKTLKEIIL